MNQPTAWDRERALALVRERLGMPGAMIPILHALQDEFGYIDNAAIALVAHELNLSQAEWSAWCTSTTDFREAPPGRHVRSSSAAPSPARPWAARRWWATCSSAAGRSWARPRPTAP